MKVRIDCGGSRCGSASEGEGEEVERERGFGRSNEDGRGYKLRVEEEVRRKGLMIRGVEKRSASGRTRR